MKHLLAFVLALNTSYTFAQTLPDVNTFSQQQIFENWVKIAVSERLRIVRH